MTIAPIAATPQNSMVRGIASATHFVLPNGVVLYIQRNDSTPTVIVRGEILIGAVNEPQGKWGLAALTAAALIRGTQNRTFQQIVEQTEALGCSVNASAGRHITTFSGRALKEDLPLVLALLADIIRRPTFPPEEVEKLRGMYLMHMREMEQDTHYQASCAMREMLYPPEHPYSRTTNGTRETLASITTDDMAEFHQLYEPILTSIAIVGDVEPSDVIPMIVREFDDWCGKSTERPTSFVFPTVAPLVGVQRRTIAMAGKTQTDIQWGVHGLDRNNPDFYAAVVGNMILGRLGMGGRLGDHVREKQGLAYSISSGFQAGIGAGPWLAAAGVNPADVERAIAAIISEIEQFKREGPTEEELADARAFLTGILVIGLETNSGVANVLLDMHSYDLGLDYIDRYPDYINGVSREAIVAVARKYLSTENYVLAIAGPAVA
jgi:zinc protease